MPLFDNDGMGSFTGSSGFHFSGTHISNLGASEYTLVGIALDRSPSVSDFAAEIEKCLATSLESCQKSPRVDNLLTRVTAFNEHLEELHGFRPLSDCHLGKYQGCLKPGGHATALYDASMDMVGSLATYGKELTEQNYTVNGIVIVLTDGMDNASKNRPQQVLETVNAAKRAESLESIVSILVGINVRDPVVSQYLKLFKEQAQFTQYVEAADATAKTMAKLAGFISRSVSSQSQSVGSKQASMPVTF